MAVPYRRMPRAAEVGQAAFLDIIWLDADRTFYGGLLVIDGKGQPLEFVHNHLPSPVADSIPHPNPLLGKEREAGPLPQRISSHGNAEIKESPSGPLWPEEMVWRVGIPMLAHSLFDACRREPDLLVCLPTLGTPEFCAAEIAPSLPFAQAAEPRGNMPAEWSWINTPPSSGMRASQLAQELVRHGFIIEPFDRLRDALRLVYPQAPWEQVQ